ncbi:MAG TPA: CHAT domain-containing protein [Pedococcus sp.]|nr:CHAT domain-containing protein [Pedococcus sp.]
MRLLHRAIALLDRPDATLQERVMRGRATVTLAYPTFERHGLGRALAVLDAAEGLVQGPDGAPVRALASVQRAGFLGRSGDWAAAVEILLAAERDTDALTARERGAVLLNRGLARLYRHDLTGSQHDLEASLALSAAHSFEDLAFKAQHNLGCLEFLRGDLPAALRLMAEADAATVAVSRATAKLDYARVLLEAGLLDRAAALLDEALELARTSGLRQEVGEIQLDQARLAVIRADYGTARTRAASARRTFGARAATGWRVQAEMLLLEIELALGRRRAAVARSAAELASQPLPSAALAHQGAVVAAEAALAVGDRAEAARWLSTPMGSLPPRHLTFSAHLHADLVRARLAASTGDAPAATGRLRATAQRLAEQQARQPSLDTRTALALHGSPLAELDLDLALRSGSVAATFAAAERWRAASQRVAPVRPPHDGELATLSGRLRQTRSELREHPDGQDVTRLTAEMARLEHAVARRGWAIAQADSTPDPTLRPVRLSAVERVAAQADCDVVTFLTHRGRLLAIRTGGSRSELFDVASQADVAAVARRVTADLAALGRGVPESLRAVVQRSLRRGFGELDAIVSAGLRTDRSRRSRLVVVPSQLLASVPWRQLPSLAGRPVVVTPSATFWVRATDRPPRAESAAGLSPSPTRPPTPPPVSALAGPGLSRAVSEARSVAALWPGGARLAESATAAELVRALGSPGVVHVAAHGTHHEQSPLFSAITLADGPVFAYEFDGGRSPASHVVLSACEVGRAVVRPGEEALGLTASLLAQGVDSIVAAVGPVRDEQAERAMTAYHRELASGTDAALALERASAATPEARMFCTYGASWSWR